MIEDTMNMSRQPGPRPNRFRRFRRFRPRNYHMNRINNIGLLLYPPIQIVPPIYPYPYFPII